MKDCNNKKANLSTQDVWNLGNKLWFSTIPQKNHFIFLKQEFICNCF